MSHAVFTIRQQAERLADEIRHAEPSVQGIYWIPDPDEVRLIEVLPDVPTSVDQRVHPFFYRASPEDNLPAPSGIALIHPSEFKTAELPEDWGTWDQVQELR